MGLGQQAFSVMLVAAVAVPAAGRPNLSTRDKKSLSQRAAQADACGKLARAIDALQITSDACVKDFIAQNDDLWAEMDRFVCKIDLGKPQWHSDLTCEVPAEVSLADVVRQLGELHRRHGHPAL